MSDKPTNRILIEEIHETMVTLKTVLLGVPNTADKGLVGEVKQVKLDINGLGSKHRKLSTKFWILVAILGSSGLISIGELTEVISLFGG